jgi:nitrogen fixation protein FixH
MIGTSMGFLRVALRHPDPVVSADVFQANLQVAADARAAALGREQGLALDVRTEATPGGVVVNAQLRGAGGGAIDADRWSLRRERPAEGGLDADFALGGDGAALVPLPRPGRWEIAVRAERGDAAAEQRVAVWMR